MVSLWKGLTSWLTSEEEPAGFQVDIDSETETSPVHQFDENQPTFDLKTLLSQLKPTLVTNPSFASNSASWSDINLLMKLPNDHYVVNRRTNIVVPQQIMVMGDRYFFPIRLLRCDDLIGNFEVQLCHRVPQTTVDIVRSFEGRSPIVGLSVTNSRLFIEVPTRSWVCPSAICYQATDLLVELTPEYIRNHQYVDDHIKFSFDAATFNHEHRKQIMCSSQYLFDNKDYLIKKGFLGYAGQSPLGQNHCPSTLTYRIINRQTPVKFEIPNHWDLITGLTIRQMNGTPIQSQLVIGGHSTGSPMISPEEPLSYCLLGFHGKMLEIPIQSMKDDLEIIIQGRDLNTDEIPNPIYNGKEIREGILVV